MASTMDARVLSAGLSVGYVGSVYIFPGGRSTSDDVGVVARRILGVCLYTFMITLNFGVNVESWAGSFNPTVKSDVVKAVLVLHVLYAGVLLVKGAPKISANNWKARLHLVKSLIIGPVSEELIYRGVIVSLYKQDGYSNRQILAENFLYFALAHLHHGLMRWLNAEGTARQLSLESLSHFVITSLFGTYACFWFLKTGSVWPSVASHVVCNYYGPPTLSGSKWYFTLSALSVAGWAYALQYI